MKSLVQIIIVFLINTTQSLAFTNYNVPPSIQATFTLDSTPPTVNLTDSGGIEDAVGSVVVTATL